MATNEYLNYRKFAGGISNFAFPHLIGEMEAQKLNNAFISRGILESIKQDNVVKTIHKPFMRYLYLYPEVGDIEYYSNEFRKYVNVNGAEYFVDGFGELRQVVKIGSTIVERDIALQNPDRLMVFKDPFTDTSYWTGVNGAVLSVSNNKLKIENGAVASAYMYTSISLEAGKIYKLNLESGLTNGYSIAIGSSGVLSSDLYNGSTTTSSSTIIVKPTTNLTATITITNSIPLLGEFSEFLSLEVTSIMGVSKSGNSMTSIGVARYGYTYYSTQTGQESILSDTSEEVVCDQSIITLNSIVPSTDSLVDKIRIYRQGPYTTTFNLLGTINNTETTYIDDISQTASVVGQYLDNSVKWNTPDSVSHIAYFNGTLFASEKNGNSLYFSQPYNPSKWATEVNYIGVPDKIVGLASTSTGVLIFTEQKRTYIVTGYSSSDFVLKEFSSVDGCSSPNSISSSRNGKVMWIDGKDIKLSEGLGVVNISLNNYQLPQYSTVTDSCAVDNSYFVLLDNTILVEVDFRFGSPIFKEYSVNATSLISFKTKLFYIDGGNLLREFNSSVQDKTLFYRSPRFVGASYDNRIEFIKFRVSYKGNFTFTFRSDTGEFQTESLSSAVEKTDIILHPTSGGLSRGYWLEVDISGEGQIFGFTEIYNYLDPNQ